MTKEENQNLKDNASKQKLDENENANENIQNKKKDEQIEKSNEEKLFET